jgi:hypothetical protein
MQLWCKTMTDHKAGRQYLHQVLGNPTDATAKDESSKMKDRLPVLGRTALGGFKFCIPFPQKSAPEKSNPSLTCHRCIFTLLAESYQIIKLNSFLLANPYSRRCVDFARLWQDSANQGVKIETNCRKTNVSRLESGF